MAIPVTPKPSIPNVPQAPGVPALSGPARAQNTIILAASDVASVIKQFLPPQWGLFNNGAPAFSLIPGLGTIGGALVNGAIQLLGGGGQSIGEVEFRLDHRISTAPQEEGAFLSYNKVSTPFEGRVTYIVSGITAIQRGLFLAAVKTMQDSLTLLSLVMPEYSYPSCNVKHHDFRRTAAKGVSKIEVDIWVEEVRITGTAAFSSTATPSAADPANGGQVQANVPLPTQIPHGPT